MPTYEFQAVAPDRGIIRKEAHVQQFRTSFNAFLQQLYEKENETEKPYRPADRNGDKIAAGGQKS